MKASFILEWIIGYDISGDKLETIDVPDANDEFEPQNEAWWIERLGGLPPAPIPAGHYLCYSREDYDEIADEHGNIELPDAEVETPGNNGYFRPMYLYRIDED